MNRRYFRLARCLAASAAILGGLLALAPERSLLAYACSDTSGTGSGNTCQTATGVQVNGSALTGGDVTFNSFGTALNGGTVTLNGKQQTATASFHFADIDDARGNWAGWDLELQLSQLTEWDSTSGYATPSAATTIPVDSIVVATPPSVTKDGNCDTCDATEVHPVLPGTFLDGASPAKILDALADPGTAGLFHVSGDMTATLTIPADTRAATYKSDATVTLATSP